MSVRILIGDTRQRLRDLPDNSVHCCVTSPPYFGLRAYLPDGHADKHMEIGLEPTPAEFVAVMVEVFREVRRVLRTDGTLWLNLGDSYSAGGNGGGAHDAMQRTNVGSLVPPNRTEGFKPKNLLGIPWSVAKALQAPYYTGRIAAERDRVWLAAIMDGEGTICGFDHDRADNGSHRSGIHIFMTNSSMALLDEAARIWPTSRSEHGRPGPGPLGDLPTWPWIVHGIANKQAVLREIYPHLIAKRQQAVVAYSMLLLMENAKRLGHSALKDETIAKRAVCTALLSDLNHQRPVVMPDWLTEPPALFEPGWYLRQDIIWGKPNPMPESVTDRCTKAHEYLFLLSKSARYHYDAEAIREEGEGYGRSEWPSQQFKGGDITRHHGNADGKGTVKPTFEGGRNKRSVWEVATQPFKEAHFATFPPDLIEPCIKAGCPKDCCAKCGAPVVREVEKTRTFESGSGKAGNMPVGKNGANLQGGGETGDIRRGPVVNVETTGWSSSCSCDAGLARGTVLDPFGGAGTTGLVADRLQRDAILIELNPEYAGIAERRIQGDAPMFATVLA